MLKIEIKQAVASEKRGTSGRTGKAYVIRKQQGYVMLTDQNGVQKAYPTEIEVPLGDQQAPYPPGLYTLSDTSFFVGEYGSLQLRPVLMPLPVQAAKAA